MRLQTEEMGGEPMTWPPRWTEPHFKTGTTSTVARRQKRAKEKSTEEKNKREVRKRDKRCRFPLCGCRKLKILAHVAHLEHKGMGGNPAGDRSDPTKMIYVCACRHRENVVSIDKGTLRVRPLTKAGTEGPVAWDIRRSEIPTHILATRAEWFCLWEEQSIGKGLPTSSQAWSVLRWLASMEI